jgi:hypothetical protein
MLRARPADRASQAGTEAVRLYACGGHGAVALGAVVAPMQSPRWDMRRALRCR